MKKSIPFFLCLIAFVSCISYEGNLKELDLKAFKISIPKNWRYNKLQGEDSFIGEIATGKAKLYFDCSNHGYANNLIPTEVSYIKSEEWMDARCYFCKVDVTYTGKWDVEKVKAQQMKEKGITDSSLVKVEAFIEPKKKVYKPNSTQKSKYPNADYIAELTYKDSTIVVPIKLPKEISAHHILVDSTEKYIIKTIYPKIVSKGITGIYIKGKNSNFTFNMVGNYLSAEDQKAALNAFKTIKFK